MRALIPHLSVPVAQVGISHLAGDVKDHDANVSSEVVRRVQLVERLLTSCVPDVCSYQQKKSEIHNIRCVGSYWGDSSVITLTNFVSPIVHRVIVAEHSQSVRR